MIAKGRTPEGKLAKDAAAGAVLVLALVSVLIGISLFWDPSVIGNVIAYHIQHPFLGVLLLLSAIAAYCFVFKWDLFYKEDKGD